jgi:hypothetical protein
MGCPAVVSVLMAVRLADCRDMRKVIAGVIQGEALFVGVAWNAAGAPVSFDTSRASQEALTDREGMG